MERCYLFLCGGEGIHDVSRARMHNCTHSSTAAAEKAGEAVSDLTQGVTKRSPGQVASGTVEGAQVRVCASACVNARVPWTPHRAAHSPIVTPRVPATPWRQL
jgi:hypothetical protein